MSNNHFHLVSRKRLAFLIALNSVTGVGARTSLKILKICQKYQLSDDEFWANKNQIWQKISLSEKIVESIKKFKIAHSLLDNLEKLEASGLQLLSFQDKSYPKLLLASEDFPTILFVKSLIKVGSEAWQNTFAQTISVVGTRKMTNYGRLVIRQIIPSLIEAKQSVVSGFMYGVDLLAAQVALDCHGLTIAVLGFGFDHCFPKSQLKIMQEFLQRGAIFLSEFPPEITARPANFVMRNRIVAGLSKATLVIEAARRSGSHITASYANDYGRLVMAVPGPINNPFSVGTKDLINQGAILVNNAFDILSELGVNGGNALNDQFDSSGFKQSVQAKTVLEHLSFYPELSLSELEQNTGFDQEKLNQLLFDLELQGKISRKWGKYCLVS